MSAQIRPIILSMGLSFVLGTSCDSPQKEPVVARIGDKQITVSHLRSFAASIPAGFHENKTDAEADSSILKALIDKTLLLLEAQSQSIHSSPDFITEITSFEEQQIAHKYTKLKVHHTISITEEEMLGRYRESGRDRALRPGVIIVESESKAKQVLKELKSDVKPIEFSQAASQYSVEKHTREFGGDMARYIKKDEAQTPLLGLFDRNVGELTDPVPVLHEGQRHFAVFKVLDEIPVPLKDVESAVAEELVKDKRLVRTQILTDSLAQVYQRRLHMDVVALISQRSASDTLHLTAQELEQSVASYSEGQVTTGQFLTMVQEPNKQLMLTDTSWIAKTANNLIGSRIVQVEARKMGLHLDDKIVKTVHRKREDLLVSFLRKNRVDAGITASLEEARHYYENHPEQFQYAKAIIVSELLLSTESEALQAMKELKEGVAIDQINIDYQTRSDHWTPEGTAGQLRLDRYSQPHYPQLYSEAQDMKVSQVGGPILIPEGYSIFKVLEIIPATPKPFNDASRKRARAYVKVGKAKNGYVSFVRTLVEKYGVEIDRSIIPTLVQDGKVNLTASN